jgi:hypothetical protein
MVLAGKLESEWDNKSYRKRIRVVSVLETSAGLGSELQSMV